MRKFGSYSCLVLGAIMAMANQAPAAEKYVVGVSNTLIGNGWREEMVCSVKAEALASGWSPRSFSPTATAGPPSRSPICAI